MDILLSQALTLSPDAPYHFKRCDVLIQEGKIAKVERAGGRADAGQRASGARSAVRASGAEEKIDCSSRILLPGLVNAHTHAAMSLLRGVGDELCLSDWLSSAVWPREKKMTPAAVKAGTLLAAAEMIRSGTTSFNDMYFHMDSTAQAVQSSGLRAVLGYGMVDLGDYDGKGKKELKEAERFANAWKGKSPLITCSIAPHATNTCSPELLERSANLAQKLNLPLHIHAAETRKELAEALSSQNKRPIDYLSACGCLGKHTVLAHGVYASKSEVSLVSRAGASLAHCPVSNLKLAGGGAAPIPEFLASGANIALGTDGAASNNSINLFESMKVGAIEQKNFRFDATAVSADEYLRMATIGGAHALGLDGAGPAKIRAGRIEAGYAADLVLLDSRSPNLVPFANNAGWLVYSAGPQNVTDVMVNGKWLMREKELLTLDEEKVLSAAQKEADKLL